MALNHNGCTTESPFEPSAGLTGSNSKGHPMKKRILIALFAGATVFGLALAFAASLGLTTGQLQANDAAVGKCQTSGSNLTTGYTVGYATGATPTYKVNAITVTGILA